MLIWIAFIIFAIFAIAGLLFSFLGISGPLFVIAGALLFNLVTWSSLISWKIVGILVLLAVLGEVFEAVIFLNAGLTKQGWKGLLAGAVIGSSFTGIGKFAGVILGSLAGAFLGEFSSKGAKKAWKQTKSLFKRKLLSSVVKILIVLAQIWLVITSLN